MLEEIKKFTQEYETGLFLLNSPTGFGKTTAVVNFLCEFLQGNVCCDKKRMYFITNLKINLPWGDLKDRLGDELFYRDCLVLESYSDTIIRNWGKVGEINLKPIKNSEEYVTLSQDIELFRSIEEELRNNDLTSEERKNKNIIKNNLEVKIQEKSEPQFRELIKRNYFYGKSIIEKNKFIKDHYWFSKLYPSTILEKYKVIFLTTAKFCNPIDTFHRMPFYLYDDSLLNDSAVFIDEFDSTKDVVLSNIIQQDLKTKVDLVKLFLNIYYSIDNLILPNRMLKISDHLKAVRDGGKEYRTPTELIDGIKSEFRDKYEKYKFALSIKSEGLDKEHAFLYFDGKPFTIVKDNSKKNIFIKEDIDNKYNKIYAGNSKFVSSVQLRTLIRDLNYSINYFVRGLVYLSDNYMHTKNQNLESNTPRYTIEESIMSIISLLNISDEFVQIIFQQAIEFYEGKELINEVNLEEDSFMRKGFNFTEIEDDRNHDLQSKFHAFYFHTTPEDILMRVINKSCVIGVSATATLDTVIGNYDIKYLQKKLGDKYYKISENGYRRVLEAFSEQLKVYDENNIKINVNAIDDFNVYSDEEKTIYLIKNCLGLKADTQDELIKKYYDEVSDTGKFNKSKDTIKYYKLIEYKLAYCYKYFGCDDNIRSFLCFNNFSIKSNSSIREKELKNLFKIIAEENQFKYIQPTFVTAENFMQIHEQAKKQLSKGEKVFWISTYKTIGSGKNIQYEIPEDVADNVVLKGDLKRKDKDFDGIYLSTPTNLTQFLSFDSDNKYSDLAKYLFQQEYLRQSGNLSYQAMKQNVIRGFKKTFYNLEDIYYPNNGDILYHNAQVIIQAVGRICRCRNKNKNIHILADTEVIDRLKRIKPIFAGKIYNKEFVALLDKNITNSQIPLTKYTEVNKYTSNNIRFKSWIVRNSIENVKQWCEIRDYVLKNPTTDIVREDLKGFYFEFDEAYTGYSYHMDNKGNFDSLNLISRFNYEQVSDGDCCLGSILDIDNMREEFNRKGYAQKFKRGKYIMSPALYKQVYLGALGEVAGKIILENQLGYDVEDISDYKKYELFDFKIGEVYFDFKHWDEFIIDNDKYCTKIKNKLNRVAGEKCFIINLTCKKDTAYKCQNIDNKIFVIPYLIDPNTAEISRENIDFIIENMD